MFAIRPKPTRRLHGPRAAGQRGPRRLRDDDGFTIFETLIAAVVLVVGLVGLLSLLDTSVKASAATRAREGATNLAREIVEDARTVPYAQISSTSLEGQLQNMAGLADGSAAAGWQVARRGVTYTVVVEECAIDDPKDGTGVHTGTVFCSDSAGPGTTDAQPIDLKRITTNVSWTSENLSHTVKLVATETAAGEAVGLSATKLRLTSPAPAASEESAPLIKTASTETLTFSANAPTSATALTWSLNGSEQTPAPVRNGSTEEWTFTWRISEPATHLYVSDGTYLVAVQAINATGVVGPPISIPVTLFRGQPAAPTGIFGGYDEILVNNVSTKVAELQWQANTERNVTGYRVYDASENPVCETASTTLSCIDFKPSSLTELTYFVAALYRNPVSGATEQGPAGTVTVKSSLSIAPSQPTSFEATKNSEGAVVLKWEPVTGASYYRIYRGSENYTGRYAIVLAPATSYVDTDATEAHQYWITAVGAHLTESVPLGPVSK